MALQFKLLSAVALDPKDQRARKALMVRIAGFVALNFLGGGFLFVDPRDITFCLVGFVVCLVLAATAHFSKVHDGAAHSFTALTFVALAALISATGGINSPLMVWMPTVAIQALLLLNLRWAVVWLCLVIFHHIVQFIAAQCLWTDVGVGPATMTPVSTLWIKINLAIVLMLSLYWYEIRYSDKRARLEARALALSELQANLQQTREQMDLFVSSLETQLRRPMQGLRLMAPIAQLELPTAALSEHEGRVVAQATHQLLDLVEELGDLAKLEAGQLVLHQTAFDVHEAIASAAAACKARGAVSNITIAWATDTANQRWALGDGVRLSRVVAAYLAQSLNHGDVSEVQLSAALDGQWLRLDIPQAHGLASQSPQVAGAGDASAVAQLPPNPDATSTQEQPMHARLLAMAGGRSVYEQKSGQRVLRLEWPLPTATETDVAHIGTADHARQTLRIMLVNSQSTEQFELQQVLRQRFGPCEFALADSGETALVQLEFGHFDVLLADLQLPGMDGLEMTRRMRNHAAARVRTLTVVGLGEAAQVGQRQQCLDAGMQWVLFRPWSSETLFRVIDAQRP